MQKMQKNGITIYTNEEFLTKLEKPGNGNICILCHNFWTKIKTRTEPQKDHLNLSFVKDMHVVGDKMTRKGRKMAILSVANFGLTLANWGS